MLPVAEAERSRSPFVNASNRRPGSARWNGSGGVPFARSAHRAFTFMNMTPTGFIPVRSGAIFWR